MSGAALVLCAHTAFTTVARSEEPPVTFFATSDSHYEAIEKTERNDRNAVTLRRMNGLPGQLWPESLGGDAIDTPRGVLVLGDLIDDGDRQGQTEIEWNHFENHFGLDGTDGLLRFPVFEGWGNHDGPPAAAIRHGFSVQQQIRRRNLRRLDQKLVSRLAPNELHYSWDWNGVHFIQTNLYPADRQHPSVRYSLPWHDPQLALQFVRDDLAATVGDSGRPVIIMAHCGFDTDWWVAEDWQAFHDTVAPYNLVAYFHGHSGTGIRRWQPAQGGRSLQIVNTGQTEKGFFVAQVSATRLRVAFQAKRNPQALEDVSWEWKYALDLPLPHQTESQRDRPVPTPTPPAPKSPPTPEPPKAPVMPTEPTRPGRRTELPMTQTGPSRPRPTPPGIPTEATPDAESVMTLPSQGRFCIAVIGDYGYDKGLKAADKATPAKVDTPALSLPPVADPLVPALPTHDSSRPGFRDKQPLKSDLSGTTAFQKTDPAGSPPPPGVPGAALEGQPGPPLAATRVARLVDSWRPDLVITTGDNNYPRGEATTIDHNIGRHYAHYIGGYRGLFGPGAARNRFFPVLGNHDWDAPGVGCQPYLDYFDLPGNERYYELNGGPIDFFLLDSDGHEPDGNRPGSVQHLWLTRRVTASQAAIQVVVLHHPPYSSGSHGGVPSSQWNFADLGVELVLSGHDHGYERIEKAGVQYVVNGAGGAVLRPFKTPVEGSLVRHHASHGALRLDVQVEGPQVRLEATFQDVLGQEVDTFVITRPLQLETQRSGSRPLRSAPE